MEREGYMLLMTSTLMLLFLITEAKMDTRWRGVSSNMVPCFFLCAFDLQF